MYSPTLEEVKTLAQDRPLVPVYRHVMGDILSPVLAYAWLRERERPAFLLESVTGGEKISRYSFLGTDPDQLFISRGDQVEIRNLRTGDTQTETCAAPLDRLQVLLNDSQAADLPELPRFTGGAVGYFAYDVVRQVENLPNAPARGLGLPEIYVGLYTTMLIFDHVNKTCKVLVHADCRNQSPEDAYAEATARIDAIVAKLTCPGTLPLEDVPPLPKEDPPVTSNFDKEEYKTAVETCREYIRAGDAFQIVLSQRLATPCAKDPFEIYRSVRVVNPSPYMFCMEFPELALVGASPEVMVRVEDGVITLRPIAGTRRRGGSEAEDLELEKDLLADEKEVAEHSMLVDLGRNDVGRVSEYGQVRLTEQMVIERYSHVMHIVSNVEGTLRKELSPIDALKACLPAGTLSGAPKVRAMEIIDELEPDVRGPYGGAVGYVDLTGNMDTCIAIRTILLHEGTAYVQAGAGIVADSVPESEYVETRNKATALLRALAVAKG